MTTAPAGPPRSGRRYRQTQPRAARHADGAARPVLWPLLIGVWKHKEQP